MDEAERRRLNSEEDAEVFMTDKKTDKTKRAPRATGTNRYVPEFSDACIHSAVSDKECHFLMLFERLISAMTDIDNIDIEHIENLLIEICSMFRLSKAVTRVYKNQQEEQEGAGETLCCFDTGKEGNEILTLRTVTSVMSRATITTYMAPDEEPLTEEERSKVELVMRTVLSFVSRNRMRDIVYELAYYDEAGYPNLRNWREYLDDVVKNKRTANKLVFRYNLRHFSLINNEFGRSAGDVIMLDHYNKLKEIIGEDGMLARLGGDNFLGMCSVDKTKTVIDYLTETEAKAPKGMVVNISTSAGFFRIPSDHEVRADEIMGSIINAYRIAQTGGMDNIVFYDEEFLEKKEKSMRVQQYFPEAFERNEFIPFYQPKVNVVNGSLVGAEALCRWFHAGKIIPPAEFIPVLEQTSEICRLDFHMLECVCRDMKRWSDEGRKLIRISINFSRKHIYNAYLPETIAEIVDRYDLPHELIEIEFTESTSEVEFSDLKRMATELSNMGFSISIDDFGIGYSSLNLIKDIPWDTLKIDKSFLPDGYGKDNDMSNIMFRHVVSMTNQLGMECITEGVETIEHVNTLRSNGCDIAQGYYFDRPLPVADFEDRIAKGKYEIESQSEI